MALQALLRTRRVWGNEVGDGTAYGIPGWGNDELEYYTPGGANACRRRPGPPGDYHRGGPWIAAVLLRPVQVHLGAVC